MEDKMYLRQNVFTKKDIENQINGFIQKLENANSYLINKELNKAYDQWKEVYDELKNYKQGTEITAVGEFERKGKVLNINYCILGDWDTYYAFDNTFQIDVDLEDLIESAKKNDKSIALKKENIIYKKN